jgi:hypothetical protein
MFDTGRTSYREFYISVLLTMGLAELTLRRLLVQRLFSASDRKYDLNSRIHTASFWEETINQAYALSIGRMIIDFRKTSLRLLQE